MKTESDGNTYTPQQVADLLGFKVASIYALLSRHELKALKSGRRRVITLEQLNAYLQNRRHTDHVINYTKPGIDLVNR
jgi:excisionase family DNA binding protein